MNTKRDFFMIAALTQLIFSAWAQSPNGTKHPGEAIYTRPGLCSTCHQPTGLGIPGAFPPLTKTDWVTGDAKRLIKIVDKGLEGKLTVNGVEYNSVMPAQGGMVTDQELTDVLNYIRNSWGNTAEPIPLELVTKIRSKTKDEEGAHEAKNFEKAQYEIGNSMLRELSAKVYHGSWSNYVDFSSNAVVTVEGPLTENLISDSLAPKGDDYAYEYSGKIIAPEDGKYEFLTNTKFFLYLWVNGKQLIYKDSVGKWPTDLRNTIHLKKGEYDFRFIYMNPGERKPIALSWTGPGLQMKNRALSRRKTQESQIYPEHMMLSPKDGEAILYRNFIKNSSPRSIGVGYPSELNMCFDADKMQWSLLWDGSFISGGLHWSGRGKGNQLPDTPEVIALPATQPLANLEHAESPWPTIQSRAEGYEFRGYVLDHKRFPTFHYDYGDIQVAEKGFPQPGDKLLRKMRVRSNHAQNNLYFLAASGESIVKEDSGNYRIDDAYTLRLSPNEGQEVFLRTSEGKQQLLIHTPLQEDSSCLDDWVEFPLAPPPTGTVFSATIDQEFSWKR